MKEAIEHNQIQRQITDFVRGSRRFLGVAGIAAMAALGSPDQVAAGGGCYNVENVRVDCDNAVRSPIIDDPVQDIFNIIVVGMAEGIALSFIALYEMQHPRESWIFKFFSHF